MLTSNNWPGNELWEECDEETVVTEDGGGDFPFANVNQVSDLLKSKKRNRKRQGDPSRFCFYSFQRS